MPKTKKKTASKKPASKLSPKVPRHLLKRAYIGSLVALGLLLTGGSLYIYQITRPPHTDLPPPPEDALYKQASQPVDARVHDLLARMTLDEKIGQMALVDKNSLTKTHDIRVYGLGGVLSGGGAKPAVNSPAGWLEMVEGMKTEALGTRLKIPLLYGTDANHGHANVPGATVFPHAIGLGATADEKLVERVAAASAKEIAATGINWSYSPSLDTPKDIRWGRVYEAFSDDPALVSRLGAAYVRGVQIPVGNGKVLGSAKHFLANGTMGWGTSYHKTYQIDHGVTEPDERLLDSEYLPPYRAASQAGVGSVMVGLNHWGSERVIDSEFLISDKLKSELGFEGFVVSDWYGGYEYADTTKYRANVRTINAGVDMLMLPFAYKTFVRDVRDAVRRGDIPQARIDDAVSRILTQKFKAGLFDIKPQAERLGLLGSTEHRALARQAVAASAVLLKNNNDVLPLAKSGRILVAGRGADNVGRQCGAWTVEWQGIDGNWLPGSTSILAGLRQVAGPGADIMYDQTAEFAAAGAKAEVGIAVVGEKPYAEGWGDNDNPVISPEDLAIIERLKQRSQKVVVVILSGRPLIITDQISGWDAVVAAWLPGSEGAGVADVLFGDKPFTGKLPITWPASIDQVPVTSNGTTANGTMPLFVRGHGLGSNPAPL